MALSRGEASEASHVLSGSQRVVVITYEHGLRTGWVGVRPVTRIRLGCGCRTERLRESESTRAVGVHGPAAGVRVSARRGLGVSSGGANGLSSSSC